MRGTILYFVVLLGSVLPEELDNPTELFDDYWQWTLKTFPQSATNVGVHDDDDKVDSHTEAAKLNQSEVYGEFLRRTKYLLAINPNKTDKLYLEILQRELETLKELIDLKAYVFAVNNLDSSQVSFGFTIKSQKLQTEEDYQKYLRRLGALGKQVEEDIDLMRIGMERNMTYHNASVFDVPRQISFIEAEPQKTNFYEPFNDDKISVNGSTKKEELRADAVRVIKESVQPAYQKLKDFMENEYSETLRPQIGLSSLPNGNELYSFMIRKFTSTNMSPTEIHELGLREVERISEEMKTIIRGLGSNETVKEFSERIRHEKSLLFQSKEEMLNYSRDIIFNKIQPTLSKVFKTQPKMNLTVEPVPESMSSGPGAMYVAGSIKDNRPGTIIYNVYDYKNTPKYELPTLSMHEGIPGHHFQIAYFLEKEGVPEFRKNVNDAVGYMYGAYVEGWALYAEYLGIELGIYEDPYDLYGHYSSENFRACRLVVDTGIHYLNWTKEQAIQFFLEHTASAYANIENEINRYITWPGQALAYKIGELKIREMRKYAQQQLGSKFDLRDFHEAILDCGPVAMTLLTECIDNYIKDSSV